MREELQLTVGKCYLLAIRLKERRVVVYNSKCVLGCLCWS